MKCDEFDLIHAANEVFSRCVRCQAGTTRCEFVGPRRCEKVCEACEYKSALQLAQAIYSFLTK